jgi:hypothetical protein
MDRQDEQASHVDRLALGYIDRLTQRSSRRGLLARCGKLVLAALGVTLVQTLPVDRTVPNAEAASCYDWSLCGLYGRTCDCCNGGSPLNYCPYGSQWFSYWQSCCYNYPNNISFWVYYWDCCNSPVNCYSCSYCANNFQQPAWCGGGVYTCTAVVVGGTC